MTRRGIGDCVGDCGGIRRGQGGGGGGHGAGGGFGGGGVWTGRLARRWGRAMGGSCLFFWAGARRWGRQKVGNSVGGGGGGGGVDVAEREEASTVMDTESSLWSRGGRGAGWVVRPSNPAGLTACSDARRLLGSQCLSGG